MPSAIQYDATRSAAAKLAHANARAVFVPSREEPSAAAPCTIMEHARILVPIRYSAWLAGELGRTLEQTLQHGMEHVADVRVTRLPRALLIEADEAPGPLLEAAHHAVRELEAGMAQKYPVFHKEMGPCWTGTLQAVFA